MSNNQIVHSGLPTNLVALGGPISFERGSAGIVKATDGRDFVDFILGYGSVVLGHNPAGFSERVHQLMANGIHLPGYSAWHTKYLNTLCAGEAEEYSVAFFKTGSEAVTAAIRLVSRKTGKHGLIRCGFLGWHDVELGGSIRWHEPTNSPIRYEVRYRAGFRGLSGQERVFDWTTLKLPALEAMLDAHEDTLAALVIDAYQACFTDYDTLQTAIRMCKARGLLVVFDETKTGGRVAPLGYAMRFKWDVDYFIVGKALSNGAPMSLLFGKKDLMQLSEECRVTGTFSQELSAIYAALATLEQMAAREGYTKLRQLGQTVVDVFNSAAEATGAISHVRAEAIFDGTMFDLRFSQPLLGEWYLRQSLCTSMAESGVLLLQGHASYVCLDHEYLNLNDLSGRFESALKQWGSALK